MLLNIITLDLTKKNIASSEYYYLLPNDILIINPIKAKYRGLRDYGLSLTATVLTSISAAVSIILLTKNFQINCIMNENHGTLWKHCRL